MCPETGILQEHLVRGGHTRTCIQAFFSFRACLESVGHVYNRRVFPVTHFNNVQHVMDCVSCVRLLTFCYLTKLILYCQGILERILHIVGSVLQVLDLVSMCLELHVG